jgi:Tfp pilus assembly protein PilZ
LQNEEKRRFQRVDLRAALRYQIRGVSDFDNAISDNISEGGLAFNSLKFIPPSTPVMLEINLLSKILHPIGRVSWCQPLPHSNRNRLGVEFLEFDSSEKKYLSDYVDMQAV